MTSRSGNRSKKKIVYTTLGKAPQSNETETIDLSHLRKPIDTSLFGLSQILSLFETATDEVRRYIAYECELMFECRICRTVFRSLANFVLHKRNYCLEIYNEINSRTKSDFENNNLTIVSTEKIPSSGDEREDPDIEGTPKKPKRNLSAVLKRLSDKEECRKYTENVANEQLTERNYLEENREDILSKTVCLENIEGNKGVFQTMDDEQVGSNLMKSEVMEIHSILSSNEAILTSDGKVFTFRSDINDTDGQKLICTICNLKFATKKTLTHHIKYKHNDTRLVYICPECKDSFANAWCVFRHLHRVHRKSTSQIRRMRDQIHSSTIIKKQERLKKKNEIESEHEFDSHPDDPQFCEACGKRFDRKAALHSHIQMCLKRNSINIAKENQKSVSEEKSTKQKTVVVKGASKRKQGVSQKVVRNISLDAVNGDEDKLDKAGEIDDKENENNEVQEIILGSRGVSILEDTGDLLPNKKFIGLISDEEEILGFVQDSNDILLKDNTSNKLLNENKVDAKGRLTPILEETEQEQDNNHCRNDDLESEENMLDVMDNSVNVEKNKIHRTTDENSVKQASSIIPVIEESNTKWNIITVENLECKVIEGNLTEEALDEFPDINTPKQYTSKKSKNENKIRECDVSKEVENLNKHNPSSDDIYTSHHKMTTPKEINLPYNEQNDITVGGEYNGSECNDITYLSDSESCSCFDDRSNDSISSEPQKVIICRESIADIDESLIHCEEKVLENMECGNRGVKRKYSGELEVEKDAVVNEGDEAEISLRERCEDYVDWSNLSCKSCLLTFLSENELLEHMSLHFNWFRYECTNCNFMSYNNKACKNHIFADESIDNCIVVLPLWKTIEMATSFNKISDLENSSLEVTNSEHIINKTEPSITCDADKIKTKDPCLRKMIMEVIFGSQESITSEPPTSAVTTRPIRNRISIRTIQKDFEFDMKQIESKKKKTANDSRVKPIKIVKNNDMNFRVINTKSDDLTKKKRTCSYQLK
ncbi:hypothetical protein Trydic_g1663 [Trypoxylus dichotomus]